MITCRELAELLFDFVDGQLPPDSQEHIEQHLGHCSSCLAYVESYRLTVRMTRELPRLPLPPDLARQLAALAEEGRPRPRDLDEGGSQSTAQML